MKMRKINFVNDRYYNDDVTIEVYISNGIKITDEAINKALMIAMNYLIENIETDKEEASE